MGKRPVRVPQRWLGAFKQGHRRNAREFIDDEFSYELLAKAERGDKEAIEALDFLTKSNNEYYRGVIKKNDPTALHNTPELYKACTDAHNARRRDAYTFWDRASKQQLNNTSPSVDSRSVRIKPLPLKNKDHPIRPSVTDAAVKEYPMPKKKPAKSTPSPAASIPKDLEDQVGAVRAIAQTYNLLQKGYFPHGFGPAIDQSLSFLKSLHENAAKAAQAHPAAATVPELQAMKAGA